MNNAKFSMNALLVILIAFSAIGLFFTVKLYGMSGYLFYISEDYPIEGTDLWIHYGNREVNGIYKGTEHDKDLMLEGTFGYGWGLAQVDDQMYLNEYRYTDVGLALCDIVKVESDTFDKELFAKNTILRGTCKSGELVCIGNCLLPSNNPESNSFCKLYDMSRGVTSKDGSVPTVLYIDSATGETIYQLHDKAAFAKSFQQIYLNKTLQEVIDSRGGATGTAEEVQS